MANKRRSSTENIFGNKGSIRPQQKTSAKISDLEAAFPDEELDEDAENTESTADAQKQDHPVRASSAPSKQQSPKTAAQNKDLDRLFKPQKGKPAQRSIYFRPDVLAFCDAISKKYNLKLSVVVNKLIENYMNDE